MTNGIGTWFCKAGFDAGWGWDDAVECAMFLYFPVWPHRLVHFREKPGGSFAPDTYEAIPLRYSENVVRHVLIRRWLTGCVGLGVFLLLLLGFIIISPPTGDAAREWAVTKPILGVVAPCLVAIGLVGQRFLRPASRRQRDIRAVLGPHILGTSDPVSWVEQDLARICRPEVQCGTATYAEAVPKLLLEGWWTEAMWAARLAAALEDKVVGEQLTDEILQHAGTQAALGGFRSKPNSWQEVMGSRAPPQSRPTERIVE
jgi:hypothetical protein